MSENALEAAGIVGHAPLDDTLRAFDAAGVYDTYVRRLESGLSETHLIVDGIHCAGCVRTIEQGLQDAGAADAQLNFGNHRAAVRWDDGQVKLSSLLLALHRLGYDARPYDPATQEALHRQNVRHSATRLGVAGFCAMNTMLYSVGLYAGYFYGIEEEFRRLFQWISAGLALPAVFYSGWPFLRGAWAATRTRRVSMDTLVTLGILGTLTHSALVLGFFPGQETYFESVVMMVFFLLIGRFLETLAKSRTGGVTERLAGLQVQWATLLVPGGEESVPIHRVQPGDRLRVRPGEAVPADGVVYEGESELDESTLTGESRRRPVRPGDALLGSTLNMAAPLAMTVTRVGAETVLSRIVRLVEQAQSNKAPTQRLADHVAGHFVSAILVLAAVTFAFWHWVLLNPYQPAVIVAITVLIIACPCALGLATPVAVLMGSATAARRGVLIKGGDAMERAAQVTDVVLDKTGTLTSGGLAVARIDPLAAQPAAEWLPLAVALERQTVHPIAAALQAHAAGLGLASDGHPVHGVRVLPGRGALGWVSGRRIAVGNRRLLEEEGIDVSGADGTAESQADALVYVAVDGVAVGRIAFSDPLRPDAVAAVQALQGMGITVHMLSGDPPAAVRAVADQVGIADARGGLLPGDKLLALQALQAEGRVVAMVGDGVNDAPALTQADLAMAVSNGSDLALEAAQVILMGSRLLGAVEALYVSRRTFRVIQENLWLSIAYNVIAVPLAMAGMVIPLLASLAMSASSLLVVGNALKLRRGSTGQDDTGATAPAFATEGGTWMRCC